MALRQVIGAYAIAILDKRNPNQIIAARKQSPLVVGIGKDGEFYLGSDASPIIEYTDKVVYLEDGNIAVMRLGEELQVVNIQNVKLNPEVQTVDIDLGQIEKGGFPHFMLKEIFEQPECLRNCMRGRVVSRTVETRVMTDDDDTTSKTETEMGVVLSSITDHRQHRIHIPKSQRMKFARLPYSVLQIGNDKKYVWNTKTSPYHHYASSAINREKVYIEKGFS